MKEDMIKKDTDEILQEQDENMIDEKTNRAGEHPEIEEVSLEDVALEETVLGVSDLEETSFLELSVFFSDSDFFSVSDFFSESESVSLSVVLLSVSVSLSEFVLTSLSEYKTRDVSSVVVLSFFPQAVKQLRIIAAKIADAISFFIIIPFFLINKIL